MNRETVQISNNAYLFNLKKTWQMQYSRMKTSKTYVGLFDIGEIY